jgi:DNA-binding HxlR family transcriptional regulator
MSRTNTIAYILRAKNRLTILKALSQEKKISAQLEKQTDMYKSHVSRTLKELQNKKLVQCLNPQDRDFKFYKITKAGKNILVDIDKIKKESG